MHPAHPTDRARTLGSARSEPGGAARAEGAAPGPGRSERLALRHWSLPVKLAAVLLVPTLFVLALGVLQIVQQTQRASAYDGVQQAVGLQARTTDLLAALAAERTAAAGVAGGTGPVAPDAAARLAQASASTTQAATALTDAGRSADDLDLTGRTTLDRVAAAVPALNTLRSDVTARRVDLAGVLVRYGEVGRAVLRFSDALTRTAAVPALASTSDALYQLSVTTDVDGELRALLTGAIAAGRLDPALVPVANTALLRRGIAAGELRTAVGSEGSETADEVSGPEQQARDRAVTDALARPGQPVALTAADWDRTAGAVQDRDADVAARLRAQLADEASSLQGGERTGLVVVAVVLVAALLAGGLVVWFVARSLLRPLRLLRRSALDVAERRLPAAVRSLRDGETPDTTIVPTPITTREEIGQVARAFDQVHEQAVRLAAEQAGLRTAFNSIFVNLSRRSQALVERQLRLIEALENHEEDPEALSELFQLDHLATRMRRNSENLLVLAGTDLSRRNTRPVPLVDVLRSSASEVEQYQRVDLPSAVGVQILGRNADDVVHLVAELLENATTFSAPDTRVEVAATPGEDGTLTVEVADRGVGMSEDDLVDANARLADPPTVDVSASRRMGLFVVGRLAVRHGIAVTLRAREGGGLVTEAVLPASVVLPAAQPPAGAPRPAAAALPAPPQSSEASEASTRRTPGSGLPLRRPGEAGARAAGGALAGASGPRHGGPADPVTDVFAAGRTNGHGAPDGHGGPVPAEAGRARGVGARGGPGELGAFGDRPHVDAGPGHGRGGPDREPATGPDTDPDADLDVDLDDEDDDDRTMSTAVDPTGDGGRTVWRRPDASAPAEDGTPAPGTAASAPSTADGTDTDTPPMGVPVVRPERPRPSPSRRYTPVVEDAATGSTSSGETVPGDTAPADAGTEDPGVADTVDRSAADVRAAVGGRTGESLAPSAQPTEPSEPTEPAGPADDGWPTIDGLSSSWPLPQRNGSRRSDPPPERTPIFEEIASAWFREGMPDSERDDDTAWRSPELDEGWQAAAQAAAVDDEEVTAAGLPRRRPRARLVPGGIPSSGPDPSAGPGAPDTTAPAPRRDPEAVRGRLASYQRGVASGRSARAAVGADPDDQEQS